MGRLIDSDDSVLVVIDAQPGFLHKLDAEDAEGVADRIRWLCSVAAWLSIPIVVTEEEPDRNDRTTEEIRASLPPDTPVHTKPVFDLTACPPIVEEIERHGRGRVVLSGLETDVCVLHSALGLLDAGVRVAVVEDACAAPGSAHAQGLDRMRDAGAELLGVKSLYYEWLRTVERYREYEASGAHAGPKGIVL
jgi:nicotinamidase-related amidase